MLNKLIHFIKEDIWLISEHQLGASKKQALQCLKVFLLSAQGFKNDLCVLRASALTLYTVLSIVPIIAMLFGIAKGFGFEKKLEQRLLEQIPEQDVMMNRLIEFANNMLANTQGGVVAGVGVIMLFWTVIKVISNIEDSFNHIWKIKKSRSIARKLSDYLSLMLFAPVLLIISSSITVFVTTQITDLVTVINLSEFGTAVVFFGLNYLPVVMMSALFSFLFIFMPNQKINYKAGFIAGIITGIIYQNIQWIYLSLQLGVSSYNAIYGSFTALPLFFIWLQIGWLIVLFGCEIAFFIHHYESYRHNEKFSNISFALKKMIALQITQLIVMRFFRAEKVLNATEIAVQLALPFALVNSSLATLVASDILVELKSIQTSEKLFQPAKDINQLSIYTVMHALENQGEKQLPDMKSFEHFSKITASFNEKIKTATENTLLKDF